MNNISSILVDDYKSHVCPLTGGDIISTNSCVITITKVSSSMVQHGECNIFSMLIFTLYNQYQGLDLLCKIALTMTIIVTFQAIYATAQLVRRK